MNITIEISEDELKPIVESTIKRMMNTDRYNKGEGAQYIEKGAADALMEVLHTINLKPMIQELASAYYQGIVEEVVKKEIERYAKKVVKELNDKGELIN